MNSGQAHEALPRPGGQTMGALRRPFSNTLRRHRLLFFGVVCVLSSIVFLIAPLVRRSYDLSGTMQVKAAGGGAGGGGGADPLPELGRLAGTAVKEIENSPDGKQIKVSLGPPANDGSQTIQLSATAASRDRAVVLVQGTADHLAATLRRHAADITDAYRSDLDKQQRTLADREQALMKDVETFRMNHRGVLPDDPTSVMSQFEKLATRLDEKEQRLRVVSEQITRLQDYQRKVASGGMSAAIAPPPPVLPPVAGDMTAATAKPVAANDPEVLSLTAQLQLVADQIDEQLNSNHRTEQHPYVVELRNQQVALQKKLEAAKQRVAAGQPPPPSPAAPGIAGMGGMARGNDPSLVAAQEVELQTQSLLAEQTALQGEVQTLTAQRDQLQKQVDAVMPARQEFEQLNEQLAAVRKQQTEVRGKLDEFTKRFAAATTTDSSSISTAMEITPLTLTNSSALPSFPRLPLVYLIGLLVGAALAVVCVYLVHWMDRRFHDARELQGVVDVPVLGVVSEIRSAGQRDMYRLWHHIARPLIGAALAMMVAICAVICFRSMSEPQVPLIGSADGWFEGRNVVVGITSEISGNRGEAQ